MNYLFTETEAQAVIDWQDCLEHGVRDSYFDAEILEVFDDLIINWGSTGTRAFTNYFAAGCYAHLFNFGRAA